MNKADIERSIMIERFDPSNPEDKIAVMILLQNFGGLVEQLVIIEVWNAWSGEEVKV